jgi:hypothetical protein
MPFANRDEFVSICEKPTLREILSHLPQQEKDFCYRAGSAKVSDGPSGQVCRE